MGTAPRIRRSPTPEREGDSCVQVLAQNGSVANVEWNRFSGVPWIHRVSRVWLLTMLLIFGLPRPMQAATLDHVRDYLGRQQGNLTSGQTHQIFFQPVTGLGGSGNQVILNFPDADDGMWCRTSGPLTVVGIVNPAGATEGATPVPGSLTAACSIGSGSGTDRLIVSNVGPLVAGTIYGVEFSDGVGKLGTPSPQQGLTVVLETTDGASTIDTKTFFLSIGASDAIQISAIVASTSGPPSNPVVQFKGRASPNIPVTIVLDGVTLTQTTTDTLARFDITLPDQPLGQHVYVLQAEDILGLEHSSMAFALNLLAGSSTVISGVFLGPTITVDQSSVTLGQTVLFSGTTVPSSSLTLTVQSDPHSYTVATDAAGHWSRTVNTNDLGTGTHSAFAMALASDNTVSEDSQLISFAVNAINAPPAGPCTGKRQADLNCDGKVNITDFSVLLFFWLVRNPSNPRIDMNSDGQVTIIDFSILLFQWSV